jgi:hypothetical protein
MSGNEKGSLPVKSEDLPKPLPDSLLELCSYCLNSLSADGAAIVLAVGRIPQSVVATAGDLGAHLPDIEFELGEGPSFDCAKLGSPIEVPDLASPQHTKWPLFTERALVSGVSSLVAIPLDRGVNHLGALELFGAQPRSMTTKDFRDGFEIAEHISSILLRVPAEAISSTQARNWMAPDQDRIRIHQASGMAAFMLNCTIEEALDRMRAYSFSHSLSLIDVAQLIVSRDLVLEP